MRYDGSERDRATSVEALTARVEGERIALRPRRNPLPDVTYGRRVKGTDGRTWLQYWFLYATNDQDRGILRTGRHEGDWEVVQLRLGPDGRPDEATFAQHSWAERCAWKGTVFVANDSHASYARAGEHGRPWPDPDDFADGRGRTVRPEVQALRRLGPLAGDVGADGRLVDPRRGLEPARPGLPGRRPVGRSGGLPRPGAGLRERGAAAAPRGADRRVAGPYRHRRVHLYGNSDTRPARRMIRFNLGTVSAACRIHGHRPWNGGTMLLGLIARSSV